MKRSPGSLVDGSRFFEDAREARTVREIIDFLNESGLENITEDCTVSRSSGTVTGNGTLVVWARVTGSTVWVRGRFTVGSTSAQTGTGEIQINFPFTFREHTGPVVQTGVGWYLISGTLGLVPLTPIARGRTIRLRDSAGYVHLTAPVTFAANDVLQFEGHFHVDNFS